MPNLFVDVDVEAGRGTPVENAGNYFGEGTPQQPPTTPFDPCTVNKVRRGRGGPTMARLCSVSTSILVAGGRDDDGLVDEYFGAPASASRG